MFVSVRERELEYVSAINTTAGFTGWITLNVTSCLATWVAFPEANKGLYLSVHPLNRPGRHSISYINVVHYNFLPNL